MYYALTNKMAATNPSAPPNAAKTRVAEGNDKVPK